MRTAILFLCSFLLLQSAVADNASPTGLSATTPTKMSTTISKQRQVELANLLDQDCGSCHGSLLKGGLGPPLLPEALSGKSAEFLKVTILDGRPDTAMPPWRPLLSEDDVDWLVDTLLKGPEVYK